MLKIQFFPIFFQKNYEYNTILELLNKMMIKHSRKLGNKKKGPTVTWLTVL